MVSINGLRALQSSRAYDWVMRLPASLYSFLALGIDMHSFYVFVVKDPQAWAHADVGVIVAVLARISQWMFVALFGILPLIRHRPVGKTEAILPRLIALVTVVIPPFAMLLPRAPANLGFDLASVILGLTANVLAIITISFLGRSFSVMPEARRLVTAGPYRIVRHPLYLFELLGVAAILLQLRSLAGLALMVTIIVLQVARARWEEGVLERAIPEYASFRAEVPFLIPRNFHSFVAVLRDDPVTRTRCGAVMGSAVGLLAVILVALPYIAG